MLNQTYLRYGLNALSRAHELNYFVDGHRGGAIISAVYLCRENDVAVKAAEQMAAIIDRQWAHTPLCAPFPPEEPDPALLGQILACVADHTPGMRQAGHNIILPTLALRAFQDLPAALTPARADGICRLVASFTRMDGPFAPDFDLPPMVNLSAFADFVLQEFVACIHRFSGRGQGWSGHLLTYARALIDLQKLGYESLARQAEEGFKLYIRRIRMGPQDTDKEHAEHEPIDSIPLQEAYWSQRQGDLTLGHQLKYPYGFYGLMHHAQSAEIKRQSQQIAYRLF